MSGTDDSVHKLILLRVRLIKKFALRLNGVDLSHANVGECVEFPDEDARMLIDHGWAEVADASSAKAQTPGYMIKRSDGGG